ncbi:hypothetical protein F5883DRAFT_439125, partial [Diaporthe sp. PMI_573]
PYTSTRFFRHPLANIREPQQINEATRQTLNWVSFAFVEWMTWQGIGDLINDWRRTLDLEPVPFTEGPLLAEKLCIPTTYCWSPALIPKPMDWPEFIDVCGFFFREEPQYSPPTEIASFLKQGPAPIYVGFGSIVIDNPERLTEMILEAASTIGARLIVSRGWSKLGSSRESNDRVLFIDDCPHEWLFKHVAAVVHHGGAGTAACGLRFARPTFVVPFFGDQFFWGEMVARAGAGPKGIPHKDLNVKNITEALRYCMSPEASEAALAISEKMKGDSGVKAAVRSFHKHLPTQGMRCQLAEDKVAMWTYHRQGKQIILSEFAADILVRLPELHAVLNIPAEPHGGIRLILRLSARKQRLGSERRGSRPGVLPLSSAKSSPRPSTHRLASRVRNIAMLFWAGRAMCMTIRPTSFREQTISRTLGSTQ